MTATTTSTLPRSPRADDRRRFDSIRAAYLKARARREDHELTMVRKYGTRHPSAAWMTRGEVVKHLAIRAAEDRASDRMMALLDAVSPRRAYWPCTVPAWWVMDSLSWEDATTRGPLSVVPPCGYGTPPATVQRLAAMTFLADAPDPS